MRLLVLSDLHLEFEPFEPPAPSLFDMVVLAGDIGQGAAAVDWARDPAVFADKPVVLVPGNHEYHGGERGHVLAQLRQRAAHSNVHLLDRGEVVIGGVRFLGATLWTDFAADVSRGTSVAPAMAFAQTRLNDYIGRIRERPGVSAAERAFRPEDALREHGLSREWLQQRLSIQADSAAARTTVVVTHHAPSRRSIGAEFEHSRSNPCYCSELPPPFFERAALWIHGHMHSSADYAHHRTRVVANPRGYRRRDGVPENPRFDAGLVIEVRVPPCARTAGQP